MSVTTWAAASKGISGTVVPATSMPAASIESTTERSSFMLATSSTTGVKGWQSNGLCDGDTVAEARVELSHSG